MDLAGATGYYYPLAVYQIGCQDFWRTATSVPHDQGGRSGLAGAYAESVCAQEPIHIPGAIQAHGALLAIDPAHDGVIAASHNAAALLSLPSPVIGRGLTDLFGADFAEAVQSRWRANHLLGAAPWQHTLILGGTALDVAVHAHNGLIIVELEPARAEDEAEALTAARQLPAAITELRATGNQLQALARVTARCVRRLLGFERVVIYRFDPDWHGDAIAEDKVDDWAQSLDGLHFPASDIPAQARELYRRSPLRWVPDRDAAPVPLDIDPGWCAANRPDASRAIDLSFARLRSLSPIHLAYHRNMGVNGSMSLSILQEGKLWGLVVCHHRQPHHPSPGRRAAAAALTEALALWVGTAERADTDQARRADVGRLSTLLAHMAEAEVVGDALTSGDITIGNLFEAVGAAVLYDGAISLLGQSPPEPDIRELAAWLRATPGAKLFQTANLAAAYPSWERFSATASGVLAVFLSDDRADMLLWFRPEEPQLVSWGGNPHKPVTGPTVLPRESFERWVEIRHGFARPWAEWELEIAESLRHGITEVIVRSLRRIGELSERLRQSQKMEAVGQLTGGIAHDFNNLLTGIIGSLELMRTRVTQGRIGELDRYIGAAMMSANRAAALVHRLLAFSRRQTLDPRPLDVNRLTASMEELIRRTVGPAIAVETVMAGGLWRTICDENQLENALLNLAINARDAMPTGGRLTIEAANTRLDDAYAHRHHDVAAGQYVAVSVTDTGAGMAPDIVARVFEPFFTTKPLGQGTGLGLSMVYGFTKQSNGYTRIYSEPGRGTTVRLYLPRYLGQDQVEADAAPTLPGAGAQPGETVLVVDDESVVRMLIADLLRDLDYHVLEAGEGAEGLRILQSNARVDLLISDVGLPGGMNGRQLADAARVHRPGLRVLFITGYAENAALGHGVLDPNMQVITKPFALDTLAAKIRTMM